MAAINKLRVPAEWELHDGTLLAWPFNKTDWPGKFIPIHWVYGEIIKKISADEKIYLIVRDEIQKAFVRKLLEKVHVNSSNIIYLSSATDRNWMRDSSPAFVYSFNGKKTERNAVQFTFNGWAKYDNWRLDSKVPALIARKLKDKLIRAEYRSRNVVLEGGAIDINGSGTMLTTEECLLDDKKQTRNPGFSKSDYAEVFRKYLGIEKIIWLGAGIAGDDTHGHVDDLCRFVSEDTVVLCRETDSSDENYRVLEENHERLQGERTADGKKLKVVSLPMPEPLWFEDLRLPASYANFYISNGCVLVPTFNDSNDKVALGILSELFPDRKVAGIHAVDLVWGLGTLHCLSHEIPAAL